MAELADVDGAGVSPEKFNRRLRNISTYLWPNIPHPSEKMFEVFRLYVRKSLCRNAKCHHRGKCLTLDKRLGAWHQTYRHSKNEWHRTPEWIHRVCVDVEVDERTTRYRKSTSLDGHYVPDKVVDVIPRHAHPVQVRESSYDVRPLQDHRKYLCAYPTCAWRLPPTEWILNKEELWTSDKIVAVSDGPLDPFTGRATYTYAWVLTNEAETAHAKSSSDIWTNPKYMSSFRAELEGIHDMLAYARKAGNTRKKFEIWRDNKSVLQVLDATHKPSIVELSNSEIKLV